MTRRSSHGAKEELPVGQAEACKRQAVCLGHVILHVRDGEGLALARTCTSMPTVTLDMLGRDHQRISALGKS